jgi:hypothetical protein
MFNKNKKAEDMNESEIDQELAKLNEELGNITDELEENNTSNGSTKSGYKGDISSLPHNKPDLPSNLSDYGQRDSNGNEIYDNNRSEPSGYYNGNKDYWGSPAPAPTGDCGDS